MTTKDTVGLANIAMTSERWGRNVQGGYVYVPKAIEGSNGRVGVPKGRTADRLSIILDAASVPTKGPNRTETHTPYATDEYYAPCTNK